MTEFTNTLKEHIYFHFIVSLSLLRLDHVRKVLIPARQSDLGYYGLVSAIFDSVMYNSVLQ